MIQNTQRSHLAAPWLVIVNPQSANGQIGKEWPVWEKRLRSLLPQMEVRISPKPNSATHLVAEGVQQGFRHILAVGGDGTAHQVVNGIMLQTEVPSSELTFALLPVGTGNDWIKTHNIPRGWDAWATYFRQAIPDEQNVGQITYQTDHNEIAKRYFINVAGLAYDAFVVRFTAGKVSRLPGKLFYFWATFRCLFQYTPQRGRLHFNGQEVKDAYYTVNLGIGKFSGGGMQLVPHAEPDGEHLALTYVGRISRLEVLLNSFRFYKGRIANYRKAKLTGTTRIDIYPLPGQEILIEADGEFLGSSPCSIILINRALQFLAPA
ncbi:MAG: diacylglycerol kinase family protein [Bacteroidota bacterium]